MGPDKLGPVQNNRAATMLGALALDTRLRVVVLLSSAGADGMAAGEIASRLGVRKNTLSGHLAKLSLAGILHSERKKTSIVYWYNREAISELTSYLTKI